MISRFLISVALSLAFAGAAVGTCCTSVLSGPVAYAPEYTNDSCAIWKRKASYGGSITFRTDTAWVTDSMASDRAELYNWQSTGNHILIASRGGPIAINCSATTQASTWPTTQTCTVSSGRTYFSKYTATYYGLCTIASTLTISTISTTSVCPY